MNFRTACLLLLLSLASCFDRKQEEKEIAATLENYRMAYSNNMGKECGKYIDSATISFYDNLLTFVKTADSTEIEQLRMDQKLAVLLTRHTMTAALIEKLNGLTLFEQLVQQGEGGRLGETLNYNFLIVTPTHAEVQMIDSTGKPCLKLAFDKENNVWKINLAYVSGQIGKAAWEQLVKESGKTEHEFLYTALEAANHKKPTDSIWHPL